MIASFHRYDSHGNHERALEYLDSKTSYDILRSIIRELDRLPETISYLQTKGSNPIPTAESRPSGPTWDSLPDTDTPCWYRPPTMDQIEDRRLSPAPSLAISPLQPVAASELLDRELFGKARLRRKGNVTTGCSELDDYVLLGGFERGSVVGVSAEEEEMGLLVSCFSLCLCVALELTRRDRLASKQ